MEYSGRADRRTAMHVAAHLETLGDPSFREAVVIEDISTHGVRILTHRRLQPRDRVIVSDLFSSFRAIAEVVYCQSTGNDLCAIGLKFDQSASELPVADSSGM